MIDDVAALTLNVMVLNDKWNDMADKAKSAFLTVSDVIKKANDSLTDAIKNVTALSESFMNIDKEHKITLGFDKVKDAKKAVAELEKELKGLSLPHEIGMKDKSYAEKVKGKLTDTGKTVMQPFHKIYDWAKPKVSNRATMLKNKLSNTPKGKKLLDAGHAVHKVGVAAVEKTHGIRHFAQKALIEKPKDILSFAAALTPMGLLKKGASYGFDKFKEAGEKGELPKSISGVYDKGVGIANKAQQGGGQILERLVPTFNKLISVGDTFMGIIPKIVTALQPLLDAINDIPIKEMLDPLMEFLPPIIGLVSKFAGLLIQTLSPVIKSLTPLIKPILSVLMSIGNVLMSLLSPYLKVVSAIFSKIGNTLSTYLGPLLTKISKFFNDLADSISNVVHRVKSFFGGGKDVADKAKETKDTANKSDQASLAGDVASSVADFSKEQEAALPKMKGGKVKGPEMFTDIEGDETPKIGGRGSSTVNIKGPLIGNFTIHTQNINEAYDKVKEEVTKVLTDMFHHKIAV